MIRALLVLGAALFLSGCVPTEGASPDGGPDPARLFRSLSKPEGAGPFASVVLLHSCAGIKPQIHAWARRLQANGYVALVVDSFSPRNVESICGGPARVSLDEVAGDALAALDHLRTLPFVDKDRIGVAGFSYGAMAALRTASAGYRKFSHGRDSGFRAAVAFYPFCTDASPVDLPPHVRQGRNNLYDDVDTPLLILIGDADEETPPAQCAGKVEELKEKGRPLAWKVYPGATHGFDLEHLGERPLTARGVGGRLFTYRYHPEATADAVKTTFGFLARHMPPAKAGIQ